MKLLDDYINKKLKELEEHPEKNKKSSGILEDVLSFIIHAFFVLLIIWLLFFRYGFDI